MNIKKELLKIQSKDQMKKIAEFVGNDKNRFEQLISFLESDDFVLQARASWAFTTCYDLGCKLIGDYSEFYIGVLTQAKLDGTKRNILRILQWIDVPESLHGRLLDYSFRVALNPNEAVAIRAFALGVLQKMYLLYPEISKELLLVCEEAMENGSSGLKNRAGKIYKILKK